MNQITLLALFTLTGCGNNDDTSIDSTDVDTDTDADVVNDVTFKFTLNDFLNNTPIEGATVTVGEDTYTTSAAGSVELLLPENDYAKIDAEADGYPVAHFYRYIGSLDWSATRLLPSYTSISTLESLLGLNSDPEKGFLGVNVIAGDPRVSTETTWLPGTSIDIDASYDIAIVSDPSQTATGGLGVGNTTLQGAEATVIFLNVAAGPVTMNLSPPAGYSCELIPSELEIVAGDFQEASVFCQAN